jgi:hypothetical protein
MFESYALAIGMSVQNSSVHDNELLKFQDEEIVHVHDLEHRLWGYASILDRFMGKNGAYVFGADGLADDFEKGPLVLDVAQMVHFSKSVLGLTFVQLASIVGVSRPSLYNHISGKETAKSLDGYEYLYNLADRIKSEVVGDISAGIKTVLVDGETLLSRLKRNDVDEESFLAAAQIVAEKLLSKKKRDASGDSDQRYISKSLTKLG